MHRRSIMYISGLLLLNIAVFCTSDPVKSSATLVIVGFMVAALNMLLVVSLLVRLGAFFVPSLRSYRRRLSALVWAVSTLMLALCSVGQLTLWDMVVVVAVGFLGYFYSLYFRPPLSRKTP